MFQPGYILLVLLAAAPLIRTLLKGGGGGAPLTLLHRIYRDFAYIAAAVVAIICFETALNISLQNYWFGELGQRYRYWLALGLRLGIFFTILVSIGIFWGSTCGRCAGHCRRSRVAPHGLRPSFLPHWSVSARRPFGSHCWAFSERTLPGPATRCSARIFLLSARLALVRRRGQHRHYRSRHHDCPLGLDRARVLPSLGKALAPARLPPPVERSSITARDRHHRRGVSGRKRDDLAGMAAPGHGTGGVVLRHNGRGPFSRPVSPRH